MSTCPEADLFSIYLDNELPKQYCDDLTKHIESCERCKAYYEKLKATKNFFSKDVESIKYSQVEDGFTRLMARKSYARVVKTQRNDIPNFVRWSAPLAVAAALIVAFVLPIRLASEPKNSNSIIELNTQNVLQAQPVSLINEKGIYQDSSFPVVITAANYEDITIADIFRPELTTVEIKMYIQPTTVSGIKDFVYDSVSNTKQATPVYLKTGVYK